MADSVQAVIEKSKSIVAYAYDWRVMKTTLFRIAALVAMSLPAFAEIHSQSATASKSVVLRSEAEIWNKGNLALADQLYSSAYTCHFVAGVEWKGVGDLKRQVLATRTAFPDWNEKIDDIFAEGDRVAIRFTSTGTQRGEFEGMAPTGRRVTIREAAFFRVVDGKIVEQWGFADSQALMQQLMAPAKAN